MPGEHAFIDRLEAYLDDVEIPDWDQRYAAVRRVDHEGLTADANANPVGSA